MLFTWQLQNGHHNFDFFFQLPWVPIIHFMWNPLLPMPPNFWGITIYIAIVIRKLPTMQMYSSFLFNFSSNSPLFVKGSVGNITATIFKRKKARFSCWFITINTSFDLHFLFCVSNHYIETLVNQFKYIIALRQPIQYAKGNVLFKIIDLTGYILTFFPSRPIPLTSICWIFLAFSGFSSSVAYTEIKAKS